jgi:PKD repeat protein
MKNLTLTKLRSLFRATLSLISLSVLAGQALAGQANVAWDANPDTQVAGYYLYYGQNSGSYTGKIDVGNKTNYSVSNLTEGKTYYFAATAYDLARTESGYSNEANSTINYTAPAANFTASTTSGPAPLSVTFTSTSSGTITGYSWNFGDGTSSTSANPAHSYSTAGTYSVSLTVTGPGGSNTQTKASLITVSTSATVPKGHKRPR